MTGLRPELKEKLAGAEGDMEQLLVKAKFEEAKRCELRLDRDKPKTGNSANTVQGGQSMGDKPGRRKWPADIVCLACGGRGHIARNCIHKKRATPKESDGQKPGNATVERQLTTVKSLRTEDSQVGLVMGSRWETEVLLDGQPVTALIDTGSPVTIVSLTFLLQLWRGRDAHVPIGQWRDWARGVLREPSLSLQTYDHAVLEMAAETDVTLGCGNHKVRAVIMVQDAAPQPLLLGTDVLEKLGFGLVHSGEKKVSNVNHGTFAVRLLQANQLPPRHAKLLRPVVEQAGDIGPVVVESPSYDEELEGLYVESAVVEPTIEGFVNLVVHNEGLAPMYLEEKQLLAEAEPVMAECGLATEVGNNSVNLLSVPPELTEERRQRLCEALHFYEAALGLEQRDELVQLVIQYYHVFALDDAELGTTDVVKHAIDTGDQPPIKQYVRRVPFALRVTV